MSDRRQTLWLTIVLLLCASPALAQRDRDNYASSPLVEISGMIQLPAGGPSAPNIIVRLERFSGGVLDQMPVDSRGKFRFTNLQRGYYSIFVVAPGYKPAQQQADMQVISRTYLIFELAPEKSNAATNQPTTSVIDARVPLEAQDEFAKARELDFYIIAKLLRRRGCGFVTLRRKPFPQVGRFHAGCQFRIEAIDNIFWRGTRR